MLRRSFSRFTSVASSSSSSPRKHTKIILWGTFAASPVPKRVPPTELIITNLPDDIVSEWKFVAVAAGSRHIALLTSEGHIVLMGSNKHGQIGRDTSETIPENEPQYFDLDWRDPATEAPTALACGTNYTIAYKRGDTRAVVVGFNHAGQLGLGHKEVLDNKDGVAEWRPNAKWWSRVGDDDDGGGGGGVKGVGISHIECGYNHTLMFLGDGRVFGCGTNQWGELGQGRSITDSPMHPVPMPFFSGGGDDGDSDSKPPPPSVKECSCGNSFSLFLSPEGRVYGCGSGSHGQLPFAAQEPTVFPVARDSRPRLVRVGAVSAGGDHTVLVSAKKGEIFFYGSLPDVGVIDATGAMKEIKRGDAVAPFTCLRSHGSSTIIVDGAGEFWGLGSNTEGQLGDWELLDREEAEALKKKQKEEETRAAAAAAEQGDESGAASGEEEVVKKKQEPQPEPKEKKLFDAPEGFSIIVMEPEANPFVTLGLDEKMKERENLAPAPLLAVKQIKRLGGLVRRKPTEEDAASAAAAAAAEQKKSTIEWRDRLGFGNGFGVMLDPDDEYECVSPDVAPVLMPQPSKLPLRKQSVEEKQRETRKKLNFKW